MPHGNVATFIKYSIGEIKKKQKKKHYWYSLMTSEALEQQHFTGEHHSALIWYASVPFYGGRQVQATLTSWFLFHKQNRRKYVDIKLMVQ